MHHGLVKILRNIVEDSGVPKASIEEEARGMRPDNRTRPRDLVVSDFAEGGRHLIIDGVVTTVYRNSILTKIASIPGYAAKQVEDRKFKTDVDSHLTRCLLATVGGIHWYPLLWRMVVESEPMDGQAALGMLVERVCCG